MDSWFGARSDYPFELFSESHLVVLAIALTGLLCLILLRDNLAAKDALFQQLRWLLFLVLFISEVSYQYWAISHEYWSFNRYMPLHLCGVASITAMIGLVTLHPFWVRVSFFIGIVPAALALVTPEYALRLPALPVLEILCPSYRYRMGMLVFGFGYAKRTYMALGVFGLWPSARLCRVHRLLGQSTDWLELSLPVAAAIYRLALGFLRGRHLVLHQSMFDCLLFICGSVCGISLAVQENNA